METLKYDLKLSALEGKLDLVLKEVKKWSEEFNDLRNGITFINEKFEDFKKRDGCYCCKPLLYCQREFGY